MRGRTLFNLFYLPLYVLSRLYFILPRSICSFLWELFDLLPGVIGFGFRYSLALRLAKRIGKNVFVGRGVEIRGWQGLVIGNNVSLHKDCYIDASGGLEIGDNVSIAHNTSILTFEHSWDDHNLPIRDNPLVFAPVTICEDVWIGCGCRILSGTVIGRRSIVAAGSVVTKDVMPSSLVAGIPAKKIRGI